MYTYIRMIYPNIKFHIPSSNCPLLTPAHRKLNSFLASTIESIICTTTCIQFLRELSYCCHGNYQKQMHRFPQDSNRSLLHVDSCIYIRSVAFAATKFNKIFSGGQPCQVVVKDRRFESRFSPRRLMIAREDFIETVSIVCFPVTTWVLDSCYFTTRFSFRFWP
jgi:hypothetical protein